MSEPSSIQAGAAVAEPPGVFPVPVPYTGERLKPLPGPSAWKLFRLMLWVHWRTFLAQMRGVKKRSPFLIAILVAFILGYLLIGYWLFQAGLSYLYTFPLVGALLSQRIVFLVFSCFFVMLIFSNLIIGYSALFKNRETAWLLTLPIRHRDVYRWKFVEGLVVSSWALIFLSAPMMLAFGRVHSVTPSFYVQIAAAYLPFIIIPGLLGSWMILAFVHMITRPWIKRVLVIVGLLSLAWIMVGIKPVQQEDAMSVHDVLSFDKLLQHTRVSQHLLLPSSWLAQMVLSCSDQLTRQGTFFFGVLLSNALMGVLISFGVADRVFYASWSRALSSRAERFHRRAELKRQKIKRRSPLEWVIDHLPGLTQPIKALVLKDARLFWRDPAQWTQFLIFFGLLCIYVINLRNVAFNFQNVYWETLISYLNLAASALTLSTLTTRFVFPQFSLEGRRLWIVGLAPVGLRKVILQKFWSSFAISSLMTVTLMVASSLMLNLAWSRVLFFAVAISVLSASLSGLAVGLGALFPNMKEDNPSKIVSGFGGTLCLAVSFIYITSFVALAAIPALEEATDIPLLLPGGVALFLAFALSGLTMGLPMGLALKRLKNLEF
ncbi:MAG TPA: hypothetical protein VNQ90_11490 [Chthoniobacteraceae bacterium]|nr:hypothetical protein [Chthoniobacteraceae bacterium]